MSIGTGVVRAVALQQIDNAPHAEARAQRDNEGLQSGDSGCEKCHIVLHFSGDCPRAQEKPPILGGRLLLGTKCPKAIQRRPGRPNRHS